MDQRIGTLPAQTESTKSLRGFSGISVKQDANLSGYELGGNAGLSGSAGTTVPRHSNTGGIEGSENPYGDIVPGTTYTGEEQKTSDFTRDAHKVLELQGKIKEPAPTPAPQEPAPTMVEQQAPQPEPQPAEPAPAPQPAMDPILQNMLTKIAAAPTPSVNMAPSPVAAQVPTPTPIPAPEAKKHTVVMSGSFGSYRGKYSEVIVNQECVCLLYDADSEGVYTPPVTPSGQSMSLTYNKETLPVFYVGLEIELEFAGRVMQVYFREKQ